MAGLELNLSGGVVSDALNFTPKAPSAASRATRVVINPINAGVQYPQNVVKFDIPVMQNKFIDCSETYLLFQVQNLDATNAAVVEGTAYSFFNRMDTLSQGQVLESVMNYNVLCNTLYDLQVGTGAARSSQSITTGTSSASAVVFDKTGTSIGASTTTDFSIPLALNGILGSNNKKMLPVGKINDLRLELTLESVNQAVVSTSTNANWTVPNIQLVLTYIDLDPEMAHSINSANGGHYMVSTESWRNYNTTTAAVRSGDNFLIPARYSSITTALHTWRPTSNVGTVSDYGVCGRVNPFFSAAGALSQIQYSIGSVYVPQTPIRYGLSETFTNTMQALHQLDSVDNASRCNLTNWSQAVWANIGASIGTFVLGQNFCSFIGKTSTMTSGMNTIPSPIFLNVVYPATTSVAHRVDHFICYDVILDISDAGLVARF